MQWDAILKKRSRYFLTGSSNSRLILPELIAAGISFYAVRRARRIQFGGLTVRSHHGWTPGPLSATASPAPKGNYSNGQAGALADAAPLPGAYNYARYHRVNRSHLELQWKPQTPLRISF